MHVCCSSILFLVYFFGIIMNDSKYETKGTKLNQG